MNKIGYCLIIFIHLLVVLIISAIPFLFVLNINSYFIQNLGLITVFLTGFSNLALKFQCPLTIIQRKLEKKIGKVKQTNSFIQEIFLKFKIRISETYVKFLTASFLILDFVILVFLR